MKEFINYFKFFPITVFLLVARYGSFTDLAWYNAFIAAAIAALGINSFLLTQDIILDRFALGLNLFLMIGGLAFYFDIKPILYFYSNYKAASFFANITIVGILTMVFSPYGFIGVKSSDKKLIQTTSMQLLCFTFIALAASYFLNSYSLFVSGALPFIALRFAREPLAQKVT